MQFVIENVRNASMSELPMLTRQGHGKGGRLSDDAFPVFCLTGQTRYGFRLGWNEIASALKDARVIFHERARTPGRTEAAAPVACSIRSSCHFGGRRSASSTHRFGMPQSSDVPLC